MKQERSHDVMVNNMRAWSEKNGNQKAIKVLQSKLVAARCRIEKQESEHRERRNDDGTV